MKQKIIDQLLGTADGLETVCEQNGRPELADSMPFLEMVDSQIFACTACGWWCEISEEVSDDYGLDEWTCKQCCEEQT